MTNQQDKWKTYIEKTSKEKTTINSLDNFDKKELTLSILKRKN